jgi:glutamate 5-kinase
MKRKRWVVKLGTGILTRPDGKLDSRQFTSITSQVAGLMAAGHQVILVSSGAIAAGMTEMGLVKRPTDTAEQQACATVGQIQLMAEYQRRFRRHGLLCAQLLLTYWDLDSRSSYRNASATLEHLLAQRKFVPIINENDAISTEEIKVGDNDRLSAHVAGLAQADRLVILSNVDGMLDREQKVIPRIRRLTPDIEAMATGTGSQRSVGGMVTKLLAAQLAAEHGVTTIIANGRNPSILPEIASGSFTGTTFSLH